MASSRSLLKRSRIMTGPVRPMAALLVLFLSGFVARLALAEGDPGIAAVEEWKAPARAARKKNPIPSDENSIAAGQKVYMRECFSCHGVLGKGDGTAAKDLERKPGNLSLPKMWEQSDGALFYKISEGRKPMPTFEKLLTEEERWRVINYVRTLAPRDEGTAPLAATPETPGPYRAALSSVVKAYLGVGQALTKDDLVGARNGVPAADDAAADLAKLDGKDLDEQARPAWEVAQKRIRTAVSAMKDAGDISHLRAAYRSASDALVAALQRFGNPEQKPLLVCRCGQAFDGAGASWIQAETEARCPYLGSGDLASCETTKTLVAGTGGGKADTK